jgi:hypothetical protein
MKKLLFFSIFIFGIGLSKQALAQCDTTASFCNDHIKKEAFVSDGQQYRALLLNDEVAEFKTTLYAGTTYRIAGCSGLNDGNLIFRLFDIERNELFSNEDFGNAPYWDFQVQNTIDAYIEAQLDPTAGSSGCAVILIGFKQ